MKNVVTKIVDGRLLVWQGDQSGGYVDAGPASDNADDWRDPNPWHPITDAVDLKHLGKLAEECGELSAAIARCIIQGVDECEPITKKVNKVWLQDEIADVLANINLVAKRFRLNRATIKKRCDRKMKHLSIWHKQA